MFMQIFISKLTAATKKDALDLPFSWIISAILEGNTGIIVESNQVKNLWVQACLIYQFNGGALWGLMVRF